MHTVAPVVPFDKVERCADQVSVQAVPLLEHSMTGCKARLISCSSESHTTALLTVASPVVAFQAAKAPPSVKCTTAPSGATAKRTWLNCDAIALHTLARRCSGQKQKERSSSCQPAVEMIANKTAGLRHKSLDQRGHDAWPESRRAGAHRRQSTWPSAIRMPDTCSSWSTPLLVAALVCTALTATPAEFWTATTPPQAPSATVPGQAATLAASKSGAAHSRAEVEWSNAYRKPFSFTASTASSHVAVATPARKRQRSCEEQRAVCAASGMTTTG